MILSLHLGQEGKSRLHSIQTTQCWHLKIMVLTSSFLQIRQTFLDFSASSLNVSISFSALLRSSSTLIAPTASADLKMSCGPRSTKRRAVLLLSNSPFTHVPLNSCGSSSLRPSPSTTKRRIPWPCCNPSFHDPSYCNWRDHKVRERHKRRKRANAKKFL